MALGIGLLAQSIACCDCGGKVRLLHACRLRTRRMGLEHIEFETICVDCGRFDASVREAQDLPRSEREFCRREHLSPARSTHSPGARPKNLNGSHLSFRFFRP